MSPRPIIEIRCRTAAYLRAAISNHVKLAFFRGVINDISASMSTGVTHIYGEFPLSPLTAS
jgi:hypothetical protein